MIIAYIQRFSLAESQFNPWVKSEPRQLRQKLKYDMFSYHAPHVRYDYQFIYSLYLIYHYPIFILKGLH